MPTSRARPAHGGSEIRLVVDELVMLDGAYAEHSFDVPYPDALRQRCDWCLGSPPSWDWAIEAKMLRLFGDNGKLAERSPAKGDPRSPRWPVSGSASRPA